MAKIIVKNVRRMPPPKNAEVGMLGNICINDDREFGKDPTTGKQITVRDDSVYMSQRDYRNALLSKDLAPNLGIEKLIGASIEYDEITITKEQLDKNGGKVAATTNGREIEWKTPGKKQYNHRIVRMGDFDITETDINNAKMRAMSMEETNNRLARRQQQRRAEQQQEEEYEENTNTAPTGNGAPPTPPVVPPAGGPAGTETQTPPVVTDPALMHEDLNES